MAIFGLTVGVLLSLSAIVYGILHFLVVHIIPTVDEHFVGEIAVLPFVASHHISDSFEKVLARRTLRNRSDTVSYSKYLISWKLMLIYGTVMLFAWGAGGTGLLDMAAASDGISPETLFSRPGLGTIGLMVGLVSNCCGAFFVGRWIGARCAGHALVVLFLCFLGYAILGIATLKLSVPAETLIAVRGESRPELLLAERVVDIFVFYPIGLLGFWQGRRTRQGKYIAYLLGLMPESARATLVDLACDEANRARPPSSPATPAASSEEAIATTS
jgi:hypothetical protein